jgi:hypothetical protein
MERKGFNTNLAAEFHVLSILHRLGLDANLTLGNKKSVDIAIIRTAGEAYTVDVKGLAGTTSCPVDNFRTARIGHFLALVCFRGKIGDPKEAPETYIVPSTELEALMYKAKGGRRVVQVSTMRHKGMKYRDGWNQFM